MNETDPGGPKPKGTVHLTVAADRFFLLPDGRPLPPGNLIITSIGGQHRRVSPRAAAMYEVTREEAANHLVNQVQAGLDAVTEAVGGIAEQPPEAVLHAAALVLTSAGHSGITEKDLPAKVLEMFQRLITDHERCRKGGSSISDYGHNTFPAVFDPEMLAELTRFVERLPWPTDDAVAEERREGEPESAGQRLDRFIARSERRLSAITGAPYNQPLPGRQSDYDDSARSAIAQSLRNAGIQPLN